LNIKKALAINSYLEELTRRAFKIWSG